MSESVIAIYSRHKYCRDHGHDAHQHPCDPQWASGTYAATFSTLVQSFFLSHGTTACTSTKCGTCNPTTAFHQKHRPPIPRVACAPYSGPIAMIRDDRRLVTVRDIAGDMRPVLMTFNAAGALLGSAVWEGFVEGCYSKKAYTRFLHHYSGTITMLGWTRAHQLLVVDARGQVAVYSTLCERAVQSLSCGGEVDDHGVAAATLAQDGTHIAPLFVECSGIWVGNEYHPHTFPRTRLV